MNKRNGFSLIEVLIVLSLLTTLLFIGGSIQYRTYDTYQFKQWYALFESDLLRLQQNTMSSTNNSYLLIRPNDNSYEVRNSTTEKPIIKRSIPKNLKIRLYSFNNPLSFSKSGTIKNPGKFQVMSKYSKWEIIFPLGKGRSYINEL
ncbi:competence type IV pilus minor pilin ComGD [Paraliobacillus salinarum]|uniref:competence type IV pilus minor pilin ComGD n=1 Tax=Paraliobacillus salinarum TaxID=1158996 RepID=UPI0015F66A34|nr:competence type IV pilus minor pilin ComGD [Paraliobacillus salinarum]